MARPVMTSHRKHLINVRLTDLEFKAFTQAADRLESNHSRLLRKMIREMSGCGPDWLPAERAAMQELAFQIQAIGRNLNQWLKAIHEGKTPEPSSGQRDIELLRKQVEDTAQFMDTLVQRSLQRWVDRA